MNETLTTLNTRRSIRRYRPEQVRPETLDAILEAGTYAPSAMGKQSAVMAVVQDPETIALLSRLNAEIQGRPVPDIGLWEDTRILDELSGSLDAGRLSSSSVSR